MKIVYPEYSLEMEFFEGKVNVLTIENSEVYARMIGDIWGQTQEGMGGWILSEKEKILSIPKSVACIINPFSLDSNERKVLNKVYSEINDISMINHSIETAEVNGRIIEFIELLLQDTSYCLESSLELDVIGLLKLYDLRFPVTDVSLLERIVDYVKIMNLVFRIELFIFVNLKQYLTSNDLSQMYDAFAYEKIRVLLLERFYQESIPGEKHWIIDKDLCMIELE